MSGATLCSLVYARVNGPDKFSRLKQFQFFKAPRSEVCALQPPLGYFFTPFFSFTPTRTRNSFGDVDESVSVPRGQKLELSNLLLSSRVYCALCLVQWSIGLYLAMGNYCVWLDHKSTYVHRESMTRMLFIK